MSFCEYAVLYIFATSCLASYNFHRHGWLDKVVMYYKNKLFEDMRRLPEVEVKASIQLAPEGYVDSPDWNFDSVARLLYLLRESKSALPVRRVLRRMLGSTRRKMSFQESFKYFPSLAKDINNDIYYDGSSDEMYGDFVTEVASKSDNDQNIIVVSNPVEARLPSAMISIDLLRNILEERAKAARYMPTTRRTTPCKGTTKTTSSSSVGNATKRDDAATTGASETQTVTGNTGAPVNETSVNSTATSVATTSLVSQ